MPSYQPVTGAGPASPVHSTRPSSISSSRRPSISSFRLHSSREVRLPDPEEMDAAFDGPDDDEEEEMGARSGREAETRGLLSGGNTGRRSGEGRVPGDYDFERDYTQPPDAPPPFQPYSSMNPAPGNTNGFIPTDPVRRPMPARHFLGGILPSAFLPRQAAPGGGRPVGGGNSGVFANLAARPAASDTSSRRADGPEYVPEDEQKDGPPSYQAALRDAVPPYWDTTVVLPSSQSPFGPLSSSMSGDEILIDGMPSGNFFGFVWNLIVSASFQFVGFILTYVLHTTHSAKYGSRVGLGITLIQFGFSIRARAEQLIESGQFPAPTGDDAPDTPESAADAEEIAAENAISAYLGPQAMHWPQPIQDPLLPADAPPTIINNMHEAELYAHAHNQTLNQLLGLPSAEEVGRANEWFSFMLMVVGWFLILTSIGGWWRVKRFEAGLRAAQRESEAAQAEAAANRDAAASGVPSSNPVNVDSTTTAPNASARPGPNTLAYYTSAFSQALDGARHIQRGFFGMNGRRLGGSSGGSRPGRGSGHTRVPTQEGGADADADEHELLDAQGFGLEPMAGRGRGGAASAADDDEDDDDDYPGAGRAGGRRRRGVGLWGI